MATPKLKVDEAPTLIQFESARYAFDTLLTLSTYPLHRGEILEGTAIVNKTLPSRSRKTGTLAFMVFSLASQCAWTQDIDLKNAGAGYAHLISFEAEPEIAAATFTVDSSSPEISDTKIKTMKLPLYREFESDNHDWNWFVQGTLSYLDMDATFHLEPLAGFRENIEQEWTAYGGLVEAGLVFPLGGGFSLASGLGLGVSRLENTADFSNSRLEELLAPKLDGSVYNWETNATVGRGSLGLRYDQEHGNFRIKGSGHFSYSYIDSFSESRKFASFSDHASTATFKLDVRHPLNIEIRKHPLYIIGHLGSTHFVGSNRDELDFTYFHEVGASIGIEKFTLGVLGVVGDDIEGFTLAFNYDY
jgi:Solitary outer membrane autotransporter beta-barrel domain